MKTKENHYENLLIHKYRIVIKVVCLAILVLLLIVIILAGVLGNKAVSNLHLFRFSFNLPKSPDTLFTATAHLCGGSDYT